MNQLQEDHFLQMPQNKVSDLLEDINSGFFISSLTFNSKNNCKINYDTESYFQDSNLQIRDQIQIDLPYRQLNFQMRANRDGKIRYNIDFGKFKNINIYAQVKQNFSLKNHWVRFGIYRNKEDFNFNVRLERDNYLQPFISAKFQKQHNDKNLFISSAFNLQNNQISILNFQLDFIHKQFIFMIQNKYSIKNHQIAFGIYKQFKDNKFAISLQSDIKQNENNIQIAYQRTHNDKQKSKAKVNQFYIDKFKWQDVHTSSIQS